MAEVIEEGAREAEANRDWSELTPVCLANVLRRLTLEDRWKGAMLVCRSWLAAARDPALFAAVDLEPAFESAGSSRADAAEWWTPAFQRRVDAMLRSAAVWAEGSLREIRVRHCSDEALCFAAERNLLNWLDPSQHSGIVPDEYLRACPQDGDREAMTIGRFMPKLKHVELRFSKLSVSGLISVSEGCGDLEFLDLFGCANLTSRGIEQASTNLKNLKTLIRPNFYIPRSMFHTERYGHWRLYDERFQTNVFQI
ncbi:F-box protein SKIP1-like isoform X2 [Musa acuminata AAA Group]|uniref:F-box domain-containing protein n=1 Tax=Musa acuminata subsp. malaccensis TaxID=214687 RepID=A0A804IUD6_MUSAM